MGALIAHSALGLEANPNLTWRDVQHIVVQASVDQLNGLQLYRKGKLNFRLRLYLIFTH